MGLVGFGDFQVVVGAAVFGDEVVPVVNGLLQFEAGVSDFLFLLFEFLLGRGFRVEEVIARLDSLLELEAGVGDFFLLLFDVLSGGEFGVEEVVEGLPGLVELKASIGYFFGGGGLVEGELDGIRGFPEVCEFIPGGGEFDPGLGDSFLEGDDGGGVEAGQGGVPGDAVAGGNEDLAEGAVDGERDSFPFREVEVAVGGDLVDDVAVGDGDNLLVFGQFGGSGRGGGTGVKPIDAGGGAEHNQQEQEGLPNAEGFDGVPEELHRVHFCSRHPVHRRGRGVPILLYTLQAGVSALSGGVPAVKGRVNVKVEPWPGWLAAWMRPPWAAMSWRAMARPKPTPPVERAREGSTR